MEPKLSFGQALEKLEQGYKAARDGWNGKGMYIWLLPAATIPESVVQDPLLKECAVDGKIDVLGAIRFRTADKKVLTGWLASQTDMLAKDWVVFK